MTREGFPGALHGSSTDVSSPGRRWLRLLAVCWADRRWSTLLILKPSSREGESSSRSENFLRAVLDEREPCEQPRGAAPVSLWQDAGEEGGERGAGRGGAGAAERGVAGGRAMAAGLEEAFGAAGEFGGAQRRLTALLVLLQVRSRRVRSPGGPCRSRPLPRASARLPLSRVDSLSVSLFACIRLPLFEGRRFLAGKPGWSCSYVLPRARRASSEGGAGCRRRRARGSVGRALGGERRVPAASGLRCWVNRNWCRTRGSGERELCWAKRLCLVARCTWRVSPCSLCWSAPCPSTAWREQRLQPAALSASASWATSPPSWPRWVRPLCFLCPWGFLPPVRDFAALLNVSRSHPSGSYSYLLTWKHAIKLLA